jgi:hypothetical protein
LADFVRGVLGAFLSGDLPDGQFRADRFVRQSFTDVATDVAPPVCAGVECGLARRLAVSPGW